MPLNLAALTSAPGLPGALERDYPMTYEAAAAEWAGAAQAWMSGITPPSLTITAARSALESALAAAFRLPDPAATMESAFAAFAATIALGMAPTFTGAPPPGQIGFATLFATRSSTRQAGVQRIADALDAWARTGTATLVAPPNSVQPWA